MAHRPVRTALGALALGVAVPAALLAHGHAVSAAASFGSPVTVTSDAVAEPGLNIGADGSIYINGPTGLLSSLPGSPSAVYKSTQGGAAGSWSRLPDGLKADLPGGGDSNIAIDPVNGALYETDLWLGASTVSQSTDGGTTWTANPLGGLPVQDRQWLASTGGGVVYMAYHQIPGGLVVSRSVDGGLSYVASTIAATVLDATGCICPPGNIIARAGSGPLGTGDSVGAIYATSTNGVKFARSTNGGLTWTNVAVAASEPGATNDNFPVVADGGNGHLAAVWLSDNGTNSSIVRLSTSTDWGSTWTAPKTISSGGTSVYPWVAVQGSKISVAYYATSTVTNPDGAPAGTQWFEDYTESLDGGSTFSTPMQLDTQAIKTGPVCTQGTGCSSDRDLLDFQTVAIDSAGRANVTYVHVNSPGSTQIRFVREL